MASNETVENMTDELKSLGGRLHARAVLTAEEIHNLSHVLEIKAEDILAAHKREISVKDDNRLTVVANYEAVIAAKDRILAANDAEIERLKAALRPVIDIEIETDPFKTAQRCLDAVADAMHIFNTGITRT